MILREATIGGTLYLDWIESEMALPENERVAFDYGAIPGKVKIDLLHRTANDKGMPNPADICLAAIDGLGKKIRNFKDSNGVSLDTVEKLLAKDDSDLTIAYIITRIGMRIWYNQIGKDAEIKN